MRIGTLIATPIIEMFVVLLLSFRDVVARRVELGEPVNPILRAYFGRGNGCRMVALWVFTIVIATIIVTVLAASH